MPVASRCGTGLPTRGVGCWVSGPLERCLSCVHCGCDEFVMCYASLSNKKKKLNKPSCGDNLAQWRGCLFLPSRLRRSRVSPLSSSVSYSSAAFGFPCPLLLAPAGVAVHSTSLATTVQRVRGLGCWGVEVSLWRALLQGCVAKRELACL